MYPKITLWYHYWTTIMAKIKMTDITKYKGYGTISLNWQNNLKHLLAVSTEAENMHTHQIQS